LSVPKENISPHSHEPLNIGFNVVTTTQSHGANLSIPDVSLSSSSITAPGICEKASLDIKDASDFIEHIREVYYIPNC